MYVVVPYSNPWEHVVDMQGCESVCVSPVCLGRKRALSLSGPPVFAADDREEGEEEEEKGERKRRCGLREGGRRGGGGSSSSGRLGNFGRGRVVVGLDADAGRRRRGRRGSVVCSAEVVADKRLRRLVEEDAIPEYDRAVVVAPAPEAVVLEPGRRGGPRRGEWTVEGGGCVDEEEVEDEDEVGRMIRMSGLGEREWRRSEEPGVMM